MNARRIRRISKHVHQLNITPPDFDLTICSYLICIDGKSILIESGPAASIKILEKLVSEICGEKLELVIPTHIHLDHGGAMGHLLLRFPGSIGLVHPAAYKHLINPENLWSASISYMPEMMEKCQKPIAIDGHRLRVSRDGMTIQFKHLEIVILHTPGHASHHQSIYLPGENLMFIGDAAGIYIAEQNIFIPTTFPPIRLDLYIRSIEYMSYFNPKILCYTHHGAASNGAKLLYNYRNMILKWFSVIKKAKIKDVNSAIKEVLRYDDTMSSILDFAENNKIVNKMLKLSIQGLIENVDV